MHPYDKIVSRDGHAFPSDDFSTYPRLMLVDWREEEGRILQSFFNATTLSADGTTLEMDDTTQYYQLVHGDLRIDVPWGDQIAAQHSMLIALQRVFGATHSIRYLNHGVADTGQLLVETNGTWQLLESQNPHVRWFFTPIELLPDIFHSDAEMLSQAGKKYCGI